MNDSIRSMYSCQLVIESLGAGPPRQNVTPNLFLQLQVHLLTRVAGCARLLTNEALVSSPLHLLLSSYIGGRKPL